MVNGKMTGGFAFVAYPAEYGNSGVMTFMINQDGVLLQKDLGKTTTETATAMTEFDPDSGWNPSRAAMTFFLSERAAGVRRLAVRDFSRVRKRRVGPKAGPRVALVRPRLRKQERAAVNPTIQ